MVNRTAFLAMIGACEGADYDTLVGGGKFTDYSKHPRVLVDLGGGLKSTAAGRYQILARTWDDFLRDVGPRDFSPASQDECALWLIKRRGALDDVDAGRLDAAIAKCNKEWASLPGSPYGQKTRSPQFCLEHYTAAGGTLGDEQPAPIEQPEPTFTIGGADNSNAQTGGPVPFVPVMLSLLPSILNLFAPRAQAALQKVTQQPPDVVQAFTQTLFDKLGQLTNTTDPIQATAAITKDPDPDKVADLQEHALDYLDKLAPVLEKLESYDAAKFSAEEASKESAANRSLKLSVVPFWSDRVFIISLLVLLMVGGLAASVVFMPVWTNDNRTMVLQAFLTALAGVLGFWIGTTRQSSAKDVLIGEMSRRNQGASNV